MSVWMNSRRALLGLLLPATACTTYGADLLTSGPSGTSGRGGSGGVSGTQGGAGAGGVVAGDGGTTEPPVAGDGGAAGQRPDAPTVPYLTVVIGSPSISVPLTSEGSLDWAHWGLTATGDYNHKAGVTSQLMDFKPTGSAPAARYLAGPTTFNWSDGVPTPSGLTSDGISWKGIGEGFQMTVPAAVEVRKLRVYLGVFNGTGQIRAALSDPRANSVGDDRFSSNKAVWSLQVVDIEFGNADKPDTTMAVSWRLEAALSVQSAVSLTAISIGKGG